MAITVTPNLTDISLCEATTGWAGGDGYLAIDGGVELQGTYCLSDWVDAKLETVVKYTLASATNLTGKHLFLWVYCSGTVDTKANGGYQIYAETDASNYSYWYVGGSDTHGGGWQLMVCDISATRDTGLGTLNVASITKVGVRFKVLTPGPIKGQTRFNNVFWDAFRYGTGLTITSGAADQVTLEDIFAVDDNKTYKYGVVTKQAGAYVIQGKLIFGNNSSGDVDFVDKNQVILFPDNPLVSDSFYGIQVLGNSAGTTNFVLGEKSGGSGVNGCFLKASGKSFSFDISDVDIDSLGLYGSTFANAGVISLPVYSATREMLNCSMTTTDGVVISTSTLENCNFISADDEAVEMTSTSHNLTDSNFISNPNAIRISVAGTYTFDGLLFTGNTVDIDNTSGGAVTINCSNGSNPTTYTGSTTINNPVYLTIEIVDADGDIITENCEVTIVKISDTSVLFHEDDITDGSITYNYNSGGGTATYITIMNVTGYQPKLVNNFTLPSSGSSTLTVQLDTDPFYNNP